MGITLDFSGMGDSEFEKYASDAANGYANQVEKGSVSLTEDHDSEEALMAKLAAVRAKKKGVSDKFHDKPVMEVDTPVTRIMGLKDGDKAKLLATVNQGSLTKFGTIEELMETVGSRNLLAELPDGKEARIMAAIQHIAGAPVAPKQHGLKNKRMRRHDSDEASALAKSLGHAKWFGGNGEAY